MQKSRKMLKLAMMPLLCGCVLLVDGPAPAQEPELDCKNPKTQRDMNMCSQRDYEEADKALNAQYKITRDAARAYDAGSDERSRGAEDALVKAQRAWVAYRDAQCTLAGFEARGGSMEPLLVSGCKASMSRERTEQLKNVMSGPR